MLVRTKRKGSTFRDDLVYVTDKWTEVPDGRDYGAHPNLEVKEEKQAKEPVEEST